MEIVLPSLFPERQNHLRAELLRIRARHLKNWECLGGSYCWPSILAVCDLLLYQFWKSYSRFADQPEQIAAATMHLAAQLTFIRPAGPKPSRQIETFKGKRYDSATLKLVRNRVSDRVRMAIRRVIQAPGHIGKRYHEAELLEREADRLDASSKEAAAIVPEVSSDERRTEPAQAKWMEDQLRARDWNSGDVVAAKGPSRKTVDKATRGEYVSTSSQACIIKAFRTTLSDGDKIDSREVPWTDPPPRKKRAPKPPKT